MSRKTPARTDGPPRPDGPSPPGDHHHAGDHRASLGASMRDYQVAVDIFDEGVADKLGVNRTDLRCLDILDRHAPMTAGALAQAARLSSGAVTFVIDRLEAAGYVRRHRDETDRRRVLVEVVPEACERVTDLHLPMIADARRALAGFSDEEVEVVRRFLEVGRGVFERNVPE